MWAGRPRDEGGCGVGFSVVAGTPGQLSVVGMHLGWAYYVDPCLYMGCSISCAWFEAVSSFLEWVERDVSGLSSITHSLDDFWRSVSGGSLDTRVDGKPRYLRCFSWVWY